MTERDARLDIIALLAERHDLAGESWKVSYTLNQVLESLEAMLEEDDFDDIIDLVLDHLVYLVMYQVHVPNEDDVKAGVEDIEKALNQTRIEIQKEEEN